MLNASHNSLYLGKFIPDVTSSGIKLSLFVDPDIDQISHAFDLGANAVEIHTGKFSRCFKEDNNNFEFERIKKAALHCPALAAFCAPGVAHWLAFPCPPRLLLLFWLLLLLFLWRHLRLSFPRLPL